MSEQEQTERAVLDSPLKPRDLFTVVSTTIALLALIVAGVGCLNLNSSLSRYGIGDLAYEVPKAHWITNGFMFLLYFGFVQGLALLGYRFFIEQARLHKALHVRIVCWFILSAGGILIFCAVRIVRGTQYYALVDIAIHAFVFIMFLQLNKELKHPLNYVRLFTVFSTLIIAVSALAMLSVLRQYGVGANMATYRRADGTTNTLQLILMHGDTAYLAVPIRDEFKVLLIPRHQIQEIQKTATPERTLSELLFQ
jgi:hypothetical protein